MKMSTDNGERSESKGSPIKEEVDDDVALLSMEKLDRASPDLWPEKIPGITDFIAGSDTPIRTPAAEWTEGLSAEDVNEIMELGQLSVNSLILKIRNVYDEAFEMGVQESKEMTRGKYLNIFAKSKKK